MSPLSRWVANHEAWVTWVLYGIICVVMTGLLMLAAARWSV